MTNPDDPFNALIAELVHLTLLGARQSTALGNLLIAKGVVTQDELDQYMRSSAEVSEKAQSLARAWKDHLNQS